MHGTGRGVLIGNDPSIHHLMVGPSRIRRHDLPQLMLRREARTIVSAVGMTRDVMSIIEVAFVRAWEHNALPLAGNFTWLSLCFVYRFGGDLVANSVTPSSVLNVVCVT